MQGKGTSFGELLAYLAGVDPDRLQTGFAELLVMLEQQRAHERAIEEAIAQLGGTLDTWGDMYADELLELARLSRVYGLTVRRKARSKRGRPRATSKKVDEETVRKALAGNTSRQTVAELVGISRSTLYRRLSELAEQA